MNDIYIINCFFIRILSVYNENKLMCDKEGGVHVIARMFLDTVSILITHLVSIESNKEG